MEANLPDRGVFRGMGKLQQDLYHNKKYFPKIRNMHQFEYTHAHRNEYLTTFKHFHKDHHQTLKYNRVKKNANDSTLILGTDPYKPTSLAKTDYRRFDFAPPPAPIRQKEEGISLGEVGKNSVEQQYSTTSMVEFNGRRASGAERGEWGGRKERRDPITGQIRGAIGTGFGFEEFGAGRERKYRAHNVTRIPVTGQKFDIISGRRLTFQ